jgi:YD repeat-containing protein
MKLRYSLLFSILIFGKVNGQNNEIANLMPRLLPSTPEAASFSKYGTYAVNLFTGIPDITIPLYEIKVGELSVPISVSYHPSGIKVNDWGSWVGLGWSLSSGPYINRKVMGGTDDMPNGYLTSSNLRLASSINTSTQGDIDYLRFIYQSVYDVEPDIYSYSCGKKSGKFLFNQLNNYQPIIVPYDPIQVTKTFNSGVMSLDIIDESGIDYQFHDGENTSNDLSSYTTSGITTWVATKIMASNKNDSINFIYTTRTGQVSNDFNDYFIINDNQNGSGAPYDMGTYYTATGTTTSTEKKIQEIDFRNGKVVFDPSVADRQDGFTGQKSLSDIKVYSFNTASNSYNLLKTIFFYQSYFLSSPSNAVRSLRLDSLSVVDNSGVIKETYKFTYNSQLLPTKDSRQKDYWGYYNGKANTTLVPQMSIPYQSTSTGTSANITIGTTIYNGRDPDSNYMRASALQRIDYPTGGYSTFDFETNQYFDIASNSVKLGGGLRVRRISNYDGISPAPVIKTYTYGLNECGYGRGNFLLKNYFFQSTQTNRVISDNTVGLGCSSISTRRTRTFYCNPTIDIEPYDGSPVVYPTVTEYMGDGIKNTGKTIYNFTDIADALTTAMIANKAVITNYQPNRGQVASKYVYVNDGGGNYHLTHSETNNYQAYSPQIYSNVGFVAFKNITTDDASTHQTDVALGPTGTGCVDDGNSYAYTNYDVRSSDNRLIQKVETDYDQKDPSKTITRTNNYYYDNFANQQLTRIVTTNSKGDTLLVQKKYPNDYSSTAPYNTMISNNNIDKVVWEQKSNTSKNLTLTTQQNNYANMGGSNYLTNSIYYQVGTNASELRASFNQYDTWGNIQEMQKAGDLKKSYVWDYKGVYPVAEVTNSSFANIAYTSFEADGSGNWSIGSTLRNTNSGITGQQSYNLSNGACIKTGLTTTNTYTVSYWSSTGSSYAVTGSTSVKQGKTINGWTYFEHQVTGTSTVTVSGSGNIDELRLYPTGALMTTYTYTPLVGMTSQCDAGNRVTYYEYDGLERLKDIKDQDGNIIKTLQYHYLGQTN